MSKVVEETVSTETAEKAPTGKDAFSAARASVAAQSTDKDTTEAKPASDDTSTKTPVEDPDKVTDQPTEVTDTDALLTPEELATLSPKDRAKAEKWQAKLTQRSQAISATEKEFEAWKPLIDALKSPEHADSAIRQLAEKRGLKLAEVNEDTTATIPAELKFLEPILTERDKALEARIRAELAPVKDGMDRMTSDAIAAETHATEQAFAAKYPDYRKLEPKMLELAKSFVPAQAMDPFKYLETLRTLAVAESSEAEKTKKVIEKINKSAVSVEPNSSGTPNERVEIALPPPDKRSMRDAYNAAKNGQRWTT